MRLEDQLTSLEPSKQLKALGVKQESSFHWIRPTFLPKQTPFLLKTEQQMMGIIVLPRSTDEIWEHYSAFSVAELMNKLPAGFFLRKHGDEWAVVGLGVPWTRRNGVTDEALEEIALNIADAPAQMLIYLLKEGLVKI